MEHPSPSQPTSEPWRDLQELYQSVDAEIARHQPRCDASGRCCRFEEYGHTLFLSRWEAELLFSVPPEPGKTLTRADCPYQVNQLCTARERRPIGCRTYFCDPTYADAMPEVAEQAIRSLKALHEDVGRDWDYRPLHQFGEFLPNSSQLDSSTNVSSIDVLPIINPCR